MHTFEEKLSPYTQAVPELDECMYFEIITTVKLVWLTYPLPTHCHFLDKMYLFFMYMYICAPDVCLMPEKVRRGHWNPRNWSHRWL